MKRKMTEPKCLMATALLVLLTGLLLSGCGGSSDSNALSASSYADSYRGDWTDAGGGETGTWEFTADANGNITGTVTDDNAPGQVHPAAGLINGSGFFDFDVEDAWNFNMSGQVTIGSNSKYIEDAQVTGDVNGSASGENYNNFIVFSDPHYYDPDLGVTGEAFEAYLARDRKLLRESPAILETVIDSILASKPKFVLVAGDMTKDGSLSGHTKFALAMRKILDQGIKVYVVPGNHDINNPHAVSYSGASTSPVPNVSPEEFEEIYQDFGYQDALARDPNSLSYLAEPAPGLWLFSHGFMYL